MLLPDPHRVRPPAVAGLFYPSDPVQLERAVCSYLEGAEPHSPDSPKAVIAPHAGYVYSGPIAGSAFAAWRERSLGSAPAPPAGRRVVLLGPAHRVALGGLAVPLAGRLETPLGSVTVDRELAAAAAELPQVSVADEPHHGEHSLEVELPFLQTLFSQLTVLPLLVGLATPEEVAEVLDRVWGGEETSIVVSSDLSHYLDYERARRIDRATAEAILAFAAPLESASACGAAAINGLLVSARRRRLTARLVDLRNSGDTAGGRDQVVGYGAFHFFAPGPGPALLAIARGALERALGAPSTGEAAPPPHAEATGACFVTLRARGELRGCIGSVEPYRPLAEDVAANARAAAFRDPRFPPLTTEELAELTIEVSVLSPLTPLEVSGEEELYAALRPGVDGLCVEAGERRALFLPQVWESLADPREFVARLEAKAGLDPAGLHPAGLDPGPPPEELRWSRFTVESFEEPSG
jgi:hypothetical protein